MKMFCECSGPCETCKIHIGPGRCIAGHGDNDYVHAQPEWIYEQVEEPDVSEPFRPKKKVKKRFGVEWLAPKLSFEEGTTTFTYHWVIWKWYGTEKQRDNAVVGLIKSQHNIFHGPLNKALKDFDEPRYRKIDK